MRGVNRVKPVAWRLTGRSRTAGLVLMYHRVAEVDHDPWGLVVSARNFDEQLQVLRDSYVPARASVVAAAMAASGVAAGTVVLTFDDGYADNLQIAKPLLERWGIPATFFVPTGMLGSTREFWWDELERLLLAPGPLPEVLRSTTLGREWDLRDAAQHSPQLAEGCYRGWRYGRAAPTRRHQVYAEIWRVLLEQPAPVRSLVLDEFVSVVEATVATRQSHLPLSMDDLVTLDEGELTEIGSHSVSHSFLPAMDVETQRREIETSKSDLEEILGGPVSALSYPNGGHDTSTLRLVADAGYSVAFTIEFGLLTRATAPFQVPRVVPPDVGGDAFARWLRRILPPRQQARIAG